MPYNVAIITAAQLSLSERATASYRLEAQDVSLQECHGPLRESNTHEESMAPPVL